MELYITINTVFLDLSNIKTVSLRDKGILEVLQFFESTKRTLDETIVHYRNKDCKEFFSYLDEFERYYPKDRHDLWWEWGGCRSGTTYYLDLHIFAFSEEKEGVLRAIHSAFLQEAVAIPNFDFPDFDSRHPWRIESAYNKDSYDDDDELRILENLTRGNNKIGWERLYPEPEGSVSITTVILFWKRINTVASIISFLWKGFAKLRIWIKKKHYTCVIRRLRKTVIKECGNKGRIRSPRYAPPKYYNAETKKKEYRFIQILDNGRQRDIYISIDGKNITKLPYHR